MPEILPWSALRNPVFAHDDYSVKDACMVWRDGWFTLLFSAFNEQRSTVTSVRTRDFVTFSDLLWQIDGTEDGHLGLCSPDVHVADGRAVLALNSWGDDPGRPNQLFYRTSTDLLTWTDRRPLAPELTHGQRAIDAALAFDHGLWHLIFRQGRRTIRAAVAADLDGPWQAVDDGACRLLMPDGSENGLTHENFTFFRAGGTWQVVCTDFNPHHAFIYTMQGDPAEPASWAHWGQGRRLAIPQEAFNTADHDNAASVFDATALDGYYYLLYAGKNDQRRGEFRGTASSNPWPRGWNRLALARSRDLVSWSVPPQL